MRACYGLSGKDRKEVPDFFVDFFRSGDGLADFFADEFLIALAETESRDADSAFGEALSFGDFVVAFRAVTGRVGTEVLVEPGFAGSDAIFAETVLGSAEDG